MYWIQFNIRNRFQVTIWNSGSCRSHKFVPPTSAFIVCVLSVWVNINLATVFSSGSPIFSFIKHVFSAKFWSSLVYTQSLLRILAVSDFVHFEEYIHYTCAKSHNVSAFSVVVVVFCHLSLQYCGFLWELSWHKYNHPFVFVFFMGHVLKCEYSLILEEDKEQVKFTFMCQIQRRLSNLALVFFPLFN